MIGVLVRKSRTLHWWLREHLVPVLLTCLLGRIAAGRGRLDGPARGWRKSRREELFWRAAGQDDNAPYVLRLDGAMVYREAGTVLAADRCLLTDVSPRFSDRVWAQDVLKDRRIAVTRRVSGAIAVVGVRSAANFYHWMFEVLPRIEIMRLSGAPVTCFVVEATQAFQTDSLARLGIGPSDIVAPEAQGVLAAEATFVPSLAGPMGVPSRFAVDSLRRIFAADLSDQPGRRRLYITREGATARRALNEDAVLAMLVPLGFERIALDGMALSAQARLFSEAEIVVGPHGAGMTNAVFMAPASRGLIDLMPTTYTYDCFEIACREANLPYRRVVENSAGAPTHDITIDIDRLRDTVTGALA